MAIVAIPAIMQSALLPESLIDFRDRQFDLLLTNGVLGRFRLTLQVRLGQPKGLELAYLLGIDFRAAATAAAPLGLTLFDLFLDARFRVDQAFSGITHKSCWTLSPG